MKIPRLFLFLVLAFILLGCGNSVPVEKAAYVGEWQAKSMYLLITQDGSVRYKRVKDGTTTSIEAPLKNFDGNNFDVGIGSLKTTFVVSKPPYKNGVRWKMVVDDVELTKTIK